MSKTALDTSVVVAAHLSWHKDHSAALSSLQQVFKNREEVLMATRVLVEAFSVMTRLPVPYRLSPEGALSLLAKTFEGRVTLMDLPAEAIWSS